MEHPDAHLVDTTAALATCIQAARTCDEVAVALFTDEGSPPHERTIARLALIAIMPRSKPVYLIDVAKLGAAAFDLGLSSLLGDPSIKKILFDSPDQCDHLVHYYGVHCRNIVDIQVAVFLGVKVFINSACYDGFEFDVDYFRDCMQKGVCSARPLDFSKSLSLSLLCPSLFLSLPYCP